jgi:hypothetical protein
MLDLYLRATDEAEMNAALIDAGLAMELDDTFGPAPGVSLDIIGAIPERDGYHVNVRCGGLTEAQEAALEGLVIAPPAQPYRVWA